jgi:hypothetical protein
LLGFQIDCMVTGVKPQGVFCEAGPLTVFVSQTVCDSTTGSQPMANVLAAYST